ncbi:MAG TPA: type IV pilin protein [Rudaea sp.]|nr:type IV pilin protein [Rudaea sp.]
MSKRQSGFTLLELMITVVVIATLAALAYYNYSKYAFRTRRSEGQQFLMLVAAAEERYFTVQNKYTSDITGASPGGLAFQSNETQNKYYQVTAALGANSTSYTLTAAPENGQANDSCGSLTITDQNVKSQTGSTSNGPCWY